MKIAIGCDHVVTAMKDQVAQYLRDQGHEVVDCGTYDSTRTHYPIYGRTVGILVTTKKVDFGVVICGTGVGIANSANKVKGVRTALVRDGYTAIQARKKYNANVIGTGGMVIGTDSIKSIVNKFINTKYEGKNKEAIKLVDDQIHELKDDFHLFDQIIKDWEAGKYTKGEPQAKIPLPKVYNAN